MENDEPRQTPRRPPASHRTAPDAHGRPLVAAGGPVCGHRRVWALRGVRGLGPFQTDGIENQTTRVPTLRLTNMEVENPLFVKESSP